MRARTLHSRLVVGVAAALALALFAAPAANADVDAFTVIQLSDGGDINVGDDICDSDAGAPVICTLRAAVQEINDGDTTDVDTIGFSAGIASQTISLGSALPAIDEPTTVNGCSSDLFNDGPCMGVQGNSTSDDSFVVQGPADPVTIRGLAITKSNRAIVALAGTPNLVVKNTWFGIKIDGATNEANDIGLQITDDDAVVGGTNGLGDGTTVPADRNVFANSTTDAINVFVGDDAQILGNYFGTNVAGTAAASNGTDIALNGNGSDPPTGTVIGGTQPTPGTCSGPCNVISGATSNGINTNGGTQDASTTTIQGNFIGYNAAGTAAIGNGIGIRHVNGADTTIGGAAAGERNYITGGASGIFSLFQGAPGLLITNNYIGTNIAGTAPLGAPSDFGITLDSEETDPATVTNNRIAVASGGDDAIQAQGGGATVTGNLLGVGPAGQDLGLGAIGMRLIKFDDATVSGNTVGNFSLSGITLEGSSDNQVTGNLIGTDSGGGDQGGGTRGMLVTNGGTTDASGNTIGGELSSEENVISNMNADAIEITNAPDLASDTTVNVDNTLGRNRGSNNGTVASDLFIDLWNDIANTGDGAGNPSGGPNNEIQVPTVTLAGANDAAGTAAAGATVRVFSRATASPGEVAAFLGTATASGGGDWSLTYASAVGNGTRVVATQTDASGDSSELSAPLVTDGNAPDTQITSGPSGATSDTTPTFAFSSEVGTTFECKLDAGAFAPCTSAVTTSALSEGAHTFQVRAVDASLNRDVSPATRSIDVDTIAPGTTITKAPKKSSRLARGKRKKKVTLTFTSSEPGEGGFQCQIDSTPFVLCSSPFVRKLKKGKHTFRVRAFDAAANPDPSLAIRSFRILRPRRRG